MPLPFTPLTSLATTKSPLESLSLVSAFDYDDEGLKMLNSLDELL